MRFFACSISEMNGESKFAFLFLKSLNVQKCFVYDFKNINLIRNDQITKSRRYSNIYKFNNIYIKSFLLLIKYRIYKKKFNGWLNFSPIWNPWIFIIIDNYKIIGPITGNKFSSNLKLPFMESLIRRYLLSIFSNISILIIKKRKLNVIAGNYFIKEFFSKNGIITFDFFKNFQKLNLCSTQIDLKEYDICFYYSKNTIKNCERLVSLLENLIIYKPDLKIVAFGDIALSKNFINFGRVKNNQVLKIFQNTTFYISLSYELAGITAIEAENNGSRVICLENYGASYYCRDPINFKNEQDIFTFLKNYYA